MTNNDTQQALEALSTLVGADDELGQYWRVRMKKRHIIYNILQPTGCHYQPRRNRRASDERD